MKISTLLDNINSGHMVLPEFQRYSQSEILTRGAAL